MDRGGPKASGDLKLPLWEEAWVGTDAALIKALPRAINRPSHQKHAGFRTMLTLDLKKPKRECSSKRMLLELAMLSITACIYCSTDALPMTTRCS